MVSAMCLSMPVMMYTCVLMCLLPQVARGDSYLNLTFEAEKLEEIVENKVQVIRFNLTCDSCGPGEELVLSVTAREENIAVIPENYTRVQPEWRREEGQWRGEVGVRGVRLGATLLRFTPLEDTTVPPPAENANTDVYDDDDDDTDDNRTVAVRVIVLRERGRVELAYRYSIIAFSVVIYLGFGAQLDFQVIKAILKKPIGPGIGAACQFIIMPLLGFGIARALNMETYYGFGLIALASSPGGGGSNAFTNLIEGDVDLSITMTAISSILSLGFMPLWMFAFGRFFTTDRIFVPYQNILYSLLVIIIPLIVGAIVNRFAPKAGRVLVKIVKPISIIFIIFLLSFGIYANLYAYRIMVTEPKVIAAALLLPYMGFLLGYLICLASRLKRPQCTAICVETGYQNPSISILALTGSFPQPEGDLGAALPLTSGIFTPLPLVIAYIAILIRNCVRKRNGELGDDVTSAEITSDMSEKKQINGINGINGDLAVENGLTNGSFKPVTNSDTRDYKF